MKHRIWGGNGGIIMKRPGPRMLLVFLLLLSGGAIFTVAIAWTCAAWVSTIGAGELVPAQPTEQTREILWIQRRPGHVRINRIVPDASAGAMWWHPVAWRDAMRHHDDDQGEVSRSEDYAGWPFSALMCINDRVVGSDSPQVGAGLNLGPAYGVASGIELTPWPGGFDGTTWRALPYRPLWPGLTVNTLMYTAILWLLCAAPGKVRAWRRRRRGECAACAYPVGESPLCTECGMPVRSLPSFVKSP